MIKRGHDLLVIGLGAIGRVYMGLSYEGLYCFRAFVCLAFMA